MIQYRVLYWPIKPDQGDLCSLIFEAGNFAHTITLFKAQTNLNEDHIYSIRLINS
jgi:hypothetical protein